MAAGSWFVLIDPADKGKPASFLDKVDFVLQFQPGSADYKTLMSGGVINPQGENLIKWQGPFATEAEAKKAQNPQPSPENPAAPVISGVENSLGGVAAPFEAAYRQITKVSLWRSLGWVVLGGGLTAGGVYWWAQTEGLQGMEDIARAKKPRLTAPVLPLILILTGIYLMWFGVKYWEDTKTIWPSDPVKNILQGHGLPPRVADNPADTILKQVEQPAGQTPSGSGSADVPVGAANASNVGIAEKLFPSHNWDITQLAPLVSLWNQESGWNPKARNPSSGAFGIAQALGHGTPGGAAPDGTNEYGGYGLSPAQAQAANSGVAYWQVVWGLNYIASAYGSPSGAWAHEQSHNWY